MMSFYSNITAVESQVISSQISSEPISLPPDGYINLTFILDKVFYSIIDRYASCCFILSFL